jgi:hypothetical protein
MRKTITPAEKLAVTLRTLDWTSLISTSISIFKLSSENSQIFCVGEFAPLERLHPWMTWY